MRYLGLCAIAKDETPFLAEWVAFHTLLGAEGFVIYDNASAIPIRHTLKPMAKDGFITVVDAPGKARQLQCYDHCLQHFGKQFAWILFIDLDEFAVPKRVGDLRIMLMEFEACAGFAANWKLFGSSGHKKRPEGLVIENYQLSLPNDAYMNQHVKVFCQPGRIAKAYNPHMFIPRPGSWVVNARHELQAGPFSAPPDWATCQIHHYYYRSVQDYMNKLRRGMADSTKEHFIPKRPAPPVGEVEDTSAARFAPMVHQLLGESSLCAHLASALPCPESPEAALRLSTDFLNNGDLNAALVLAGKARRAFPDVEATRLLFARMQVLIPEREA